MIAGGYACDGNDEYFVAVDLETDDCGDEEVSMFSDCYDDDSSELDDYYSYYSQLEDDNESFQCWVDNACEYADDSDIINDVWLFWFMLVVNILFWLFTCYVRKNNTSNSTKANN